MSRRKDSSCTKLVGLGGFEPPTSPLSGVRSNQLSYRPGIHRPGLHPAIILTAVGDNSNVLYNMNQIACVGTCANLVTL